MLAAAYAALMARPTPESVRPAAPQNSAVLESRRGIARGPVGGPVRCGACGMLKASVI